MDSKLLLKRWLPTLFWAMSMFVLSSLPGADFSGEKDTNFLIRKSLHLIEYLILCLCFFRGTKKISLSVLYSIMYAVFDELHQSFIPTRTGRVSDIVIDATSVILTGLFLWKYFQSLPNKLKNWLSE